jgi:excisionase family DNA binding protein
MIQMFADYRDIVSVEDIMGMLNLGKSSIYSLLRSHQLRHVRIGTKYIIPKQSVIDFVTGMCYTDNRITGGRFQEVNSERRNSL